MKLTTNPPQTVGAYWFYDTRYDTGPSVVMVRMYCGSLSVHNWGIPPTERAEFLWAGPIPPPEKSV